MEKFSSVLAGVFQLGLAVIIIIIVEGRPRWHTTNARHDPCRLLADRTLVPSFARFRF
jgi:hypothetical protein